MLSSFKATARYIAVQSIKRSYRRAAGQWKTNFRRASVTDQLLKVRKLVTKRLKDHNHKSTLPRRVGRPIRHIAATDHPCFRRHLDLAHWGSTTRNITDSNTTENSENVKRGLVKEEELSNSDVEDVETTEDSSTTVSTRNTLESDETESTCEIVKRVSQRRRVGFWRR